MEKYHEEYTNDSKTLIRLKELTERIKHLPISEQSKILESISTKSKEINDEYKNELRNYELLDKKRQVAPKVVDKIFVSNNNKSTCKKNENTKIQEYSLQIKKIKALDLELFKKYIDNLYKEGLLTEETITYLSLGIVEELISYRKLFDDEKDINFIKELKKELIILEQKIDFISKYKKTKNSNVSHIKERMRIVFFETSSERAYFIEDVRGDIDFYDTYKKLLNSLIDNNRIDRRSFTDDETVNGLLEVRDLSGQTRVIYDQIDLHTCIVIGALIKKVDKNSIYKNQIVNRYKLYLKNKDKILNLLNNEDFIKRQDEYMKQINKMFNNKVKKLVLKKDDKNE